MMIKSGETAIAGPPRSPNRFSAYFTPHSSAGSRFAAIHLERVRNGRLETAFGDISWADFQDVE
jgi:hypothetical protein